MQRTLFSNFYQIFSAQIPPKDTDKTRKTLLAFFLQLETRKSHFRKRQAKLFSVNVIVPKKKQFHLAKLLFLKLESVLKPDGGTLWPNKSLGKRRTEPESAARLMTLWL